MEEEEEQEPGQVFHLFMLEFPNPLTCKVSVTFTCTWSSYCPRTLEKCLLTTVIAACGRDTNHLSLSREVGDDPEVIRQKLVMYVIL